MPACIWSDQRLSPVWSTARGASQHPHVKVQMCDPIIIRPSVVSFGLPSETPLLFSLVSAPAKGCDSPKQVPHGKVQEHNLNTGRAVEVLCDKGYNLVGDSLVVCMGSNTWSSTFPTCQREKLCTETLTGS